MKRSDRFSLLGFSSDCEVESVAVEGGEGGEGVWAERELPTFQLFISQR